MRKFLIGAIVLALIWHLLSVYPSPTAGVLAPAEPLQKDLKPGEVADWTVDKFRITPLARYSLKARILHREDYYFDAPAAISPLDLVLGWGRMSDPAVYDQLHLKQSLRWYYYSWWGDPPLSEGEIVRSSSNTHIIPATPEIKSRLFWLRAGDVVKLSGYLVRVSGFGDEPWSTSLSRTDTGNHSCEIMWVTEAEKVGR